MYFGCALYGRKCQEMSCRTDHSTSWGVMFRSGHWDICLENYLAQTCFHWHWAEMNNLFAWVQPKDGHGVSERQCTIVLENSWNGLFLLHAIHTMYPLLWPTCEPLLHIRGQLCTLLARTVGEWNVRNLIQILFIRIKLPSTIGRSNMSLASELGDLPAIHSCELKL